MVETTGRLRPLPGQPRTVTISKSTPDKAGQPSLSWTGLRQQSVRTDKQGGGQPEWALADFVAPKGTGMRDYLARLP